ncbi:MAG: MFS transporter [Anaerolineaceae bacterium]|nr:MFS transporter [Anaerolineaceae bacterium]
MTISQSARGVRLFTAGAFFCMFIIGFVDNLKGPTMPALLAETNFSYSQGGTILLAAYLGFFVATLLTGVLADIAGRRTVLLASATSISLGVIGFVTFKTFLGMAFSFFVIGLGTGGFDLGGNSIIVDLQPQQKGRYLNLISVLHGVSAMISPLLAGFLIAGSFGWRPGYLVVLALAVIMLVFAGLTKYPKGAGTFHEGMNFKTLRKQIVMPEMRWLYILMMAYVGLEMSMASWLPAYLQKVHGLSIQASSESISLFFGGLMTGRLLGSFVVHQHRYLRALLFASVGGLTCLTLGISGPTGLAFFLPLSGLFFSITFSITTAFTTDMHQDNVGSIIGLLFSFAGLGGAIGPWLMGLLIDKAGMSIGFSLVIPYTVLILISVLMVRKQSNSQAVVEAV